MRRVLGLAGVALLLLGGSAARADEVVPGPTSVEGDASFFEVQDHGDGTHTIRWMCQATAGGAAVASTGVQCTVWQGDAKLGSGGQGMSFNHVVTRPYGLTLPHGPFRICWVARAYGMDGSIIESTGCKDF